MRLLQKLFSGIFSGELAPAPASVPAPPAPRPAPDLLAVDGQFIDLSALTTTELAALEAHLLASRQQRHSQLLHYLRELAAERERLLADHDPRLWLTTLQVLFGESLGHRVAAQDIGPGMQLQHLVLSRGQPDHIEAGAAGITLMYGPPGTGSSYHIAGDTITRVVVRPPAGHQP